MKKGWLERFAKVDWRLRVELGGCPMILELRRGWDVRVGGLDMDLFYFCLEGGFQIHTPRGPRRVSSGEVVIVPARKGFHFSLGSSARARVARFRVKRPVADSNTRGGMLTFRFGSTTLAWLNVLRVELSSDESNVNGPGIKTAMIGLLGSLNTSNPSAPRRGARLRQLSSIEKERIRTWADELDPRSRPSLRDLANIVEMSPDYCARLFRQSFGQSFEKWIIAARMRSAAFRIGESTLPISAISEEYGFSTPYFFSRQFKQIMGCSPRAYRSDQAF